MGTSEYIRLGGEDGLRLLVGSIEIDGAIETLGDSLDASVGSTEGSNDSDGSRLVVGVPL